VQQNIKEGIEGHAVNWYSDVFNIVFSNLDREAANNVWKKQLTKSSKSKKRKEEHDDDDD
jgi:Lon-like ATP-dependent protease